MVPEPIDGEGEREREMGMRRAPLRIQFTHGLHIKIRSETLIWKQLPTLDTGNR
jgi:hypothetical protein